MSVYLDAGQPLWRPRSEADLQAAIDAAILVESHYLDVKREIPEGSSANKELARDLAQFGNDGGTLLIGVAEHAHGLALTPVRLAGLRERVDAVAVTRIDPPLPVLTTELPSAADPSQGYLLVHVPASPAAPHMVDHRYVGRRDSQRYHLPDPEVLRLHERRRGRERSTLDLIRAEFDRDPIGGDRQRQAHLFLLAEPDAPRPDMLLDHLTQPVLWSLIDGGGYTRPEVIAALGQADKMAPALRSATQFAGRANGAALSTYGIGADRTPLPDERTGLVNEDFVEIEFSDAGAIRIVLGRLSDRLPDDPCQQQWVFEGGAVIYVRRLLGVLLHLSTEVGYLGTWHLGVGATGLRGLTSYDNRYGYGDHRFETSTYTRTASVTYADLEQRPGNVTRQLLGGFLRNLGTEGRYQKELADPSPD